MPGGRYSLQCENPQMLKQDLKPDEDEHDATHDGELHPKTWTA